MTFDFTLILTLLTLLSGIVLMVDRLFFYSKRHEKILQVEFSELAKLAQKQQTNTVKLEKIRSKYEPKPVELARSLFPVLFIVLVVRSFIFEPYQIPSDSMLPTLRNGDFILVNKFTYGLRLPVINSKIAGGGVPQRGDVLVFRAPFNPAVNYIKRVVGIPGDVITLKGNVLNINGGNIPSGMVKPPAGARHPVHREQLGSTSHYVHPLPRGIAGQESWIVPEDHYFVMGDNRPNSHDSRYWGFVPDAMIVGKAVYVWMYWSKWYTIPGFSEVGYIDHNI